MYELEREREKDIETEKEKKKIGKEKFHICHKYMYCVT